METLQHIGIGFLSLILIIAGIAWQAFTYIGDEEAGEVAFYKYASPVAIGLVCLVSYSLFGLMSWIASNEVERFWPIFGSIIGLTIVFGIKNLVGPFFLGLALSWAVFQRFINGAWDLIPVYDVVIDALLFWAPSWVQITYIWASIITFFIGGLFALGSN